MVATEAAPQRRVYLTPHQQRALGVAAPTLQLLMERAEITTGGGSFTWAGLSAETAQETPVRTLQNHTRALVAAYCLTTADHGRAGVRYTVAPSWWAQVELLPLAGGSAPAVVVDDEDEDEELTTGEYVRQDEDDEEIPRNGFYVRVRSGSAPKMVPQESAPVLVRIESAPETVLYPHPDDYADEAEALKMVRFGLESAPKLVRQAPPACAPSRMRCSITHTNTLVTNVISTATPSSDSNVGVLMGEENIYSSLPNSTTGLVTPTVSEFRDTRGLGVTSSAPAPAGAARTTPRPADPEAPLSLDQRALADAVLAKFDLAAHHQPGFLGDLDRPRLVESVESLVRRRMTRERFEGVWDWARRGATVGRYTAAAVLNALHKRPTDEAAVAAGIRPGGDRRGIVHGELRPEVLRAQAEAAGVALERQW